MNENNELSDIVLNKNSSSGSGKKMLLAVATLGVILIAVITLMRSCGSNNSEGAPKAVIPPKPTNALVATEESVVPQKGEEPLFEEVDVVEEPAVQSDELDKIAQKLKQESVQQQESPVVVQKPKPVIQEHVAKSVQEPKTTTKATSGIKYYVQVGSFTKYEPNKKFLESIKKLRYKYTYHKVKINGKTVNKVLVGPFATEKEAKKARSVLRSKIEPGAFLVKLQ